MINLLLLSSISGFYYQILNFDNITREEEVVESKSQSLESKNITMFAGSSNDVFEALANGFIIKSFGRQIAITEKNSLSTCFHTANSTACEIEGPSTVILTGSKESKYFRVGEKVIALCFILVVKIDCEVIYVR
ncbi:MAG: hypothetical protein AAFQ29_08995 [Pseudomonadota bacterium]